MHEVNDDYVAEAMELARRLMGLADRGNAAGREDCGILLGVMRDCAYKIRREALRHTDLQRTSVEGPAETAT